MAGLDPPFLRILDDLPGVRSYRVLAPRRTSDASSPDARLKLRTDAGMRQFDVYQYRSHLSHRTADHIVTAARRSTEPVLILAPHVGAGLAARFVRAGVNYLDAHGNCHIGAPPLYVHIEGKTAGPISRADKGLRSAAYQVLFAYLAEPTLLDSPIRAVAEQAGVSRQPVSDMRRRLLDEGYIFETKTARLWYPQRRADALSLWLHGYEVMVRPAMVWGTYRTQEVDPKRLERRVSRVFAAARISAFRWGGCAAGFRMTGHYRGERTVVHIPEAAGDLRKELRALSDPRGNLVLMDAFGRINWAEGGETVHPLLVYSEMLHDSEEREREAAQELYDRYLVPVWEREA